ncbi:hypothetical protein DSO57_1009480 [Entomophthora muscae]|uniref:Uncharacterized protein n=1 Tax=Entomophthora muscae TaxID=34485 RepID=A0ACC2UHC2_9FUNG|nr:hypothetical protein DSO57_1009480 [Entomophthora muscae]
MFLKFGLLLLSGGVCFRIHAVSNPPSTEPIQKNPLDYREYHGLLLTNQLRVLLVSDEDVDKASVALAVATGAQDDPAGIPGLAHYIEHVLYQGSEKYPNPYEFMEFLDANGGERNALTESDRTLYHYYVDPEALEDSLDIFADLFAHPRFGEAEVNGEASVIDYEYNRDMPFTEESLRHTSFAALNTSHPIANFTCGNYATLVTEPRNRGVNIRDLVVSHHRQHYSANRMSLVVIGKESIKELRNMVIPRFSTIPDRNTTVKRQGSPFTRDNLATNVLISPESDDKEFRVHFALTPTHSGFYAGLEVLKYLFNLYLEKCLLKILEERGLVDRVEITNEDNHREFSILAFNFGVTSQGMERKQEILKALFAYIDAIKWQGVNRKLYSKYVFASRNAPAEYDFPDDYALALASRLNIGISFSDVLYFFSNSVASESSSIMQVANQFNINNFIAYTINQFEGPSLTEPWYGLNYTASKFTQPFLNILNSTKAIDFEIRLPYMKPNNLSGISNKEYFQAEAKLLANNSIGIVKAISLEPVDKAYFELEFDFQHNPTPGLLAHILLLKESMACICDFSSKDFPQPTTHHSFTVQGVSLLVLFEDTQSAQETAVAFSRLLKSFRATFRSLELARAKVLETFSSPESTDEMDSTTQLTRMIDPNFLDDMTKQESVKSVTLAQFERFVGKLFDSIKFNIVCSDKSLLNSLVSIKAKLEGIFGMDPSNMQYSRGGLSWWHHGGDFIYSIPAPKGKARTIFYLHLYDAGEMGDYAISLVATALFKSRFYHHLRTLRELGYNVNSESLTTPHGGGIMTTINTNRAVGYIEISLEGFLDSFRQGILNITSHKLKQTITYLIRGCTQTLHRMRLSRDEPWSEIKAYTTKREKLQTAIEYLPTLTRVKFVEFINSRLKKSSPNHFKLSIHEIPFEL